MYRCRLQVAVETLVRKIVRRSVITAKGSFRFFTVSWDRYVGIVTTPSNCGWAITELPRRPRHPKRIPYPSTTLTFIEARPTHFRRLFETRKERAGVQKLQCYLYWKRPYNFATVRLFCF